MLTAIADTHALLWYLLADPRLSGTAKATIDDANVQHANIGVSSITFSEIVYLQEKSRIPATALQDVFTAMDKVDPLFVEIPVTREIIVAMATIPRHPGARDG